MKYAKGYGPRKLSWSREDWLHHPTGEVVPNSDPRVPKTIAESKKRREWMLIGSQANIDQGYYRRDMDMNTAADAVPTMTATWHPTDGPAETLIRSNARDVYWACVKHFQANFRDLVK